MSGELRGGRLVGGFVGEQFAAPEAVDALRATRREERRGEVVRLSACDPLNLVGIVTPGPRVQATLPTRSCTSTAFRSWTENAESEAPRRAALAGRAAHARLTPPGAPAGRRRCDRCLRNSCLLSAR